MAIKIYKNVLPEDAIQELNKYLDNNVYRNIWRQSIYWQKNLKANNPTALTISDLPVFIAAPIIERFQKLDKKYRKYKMSLYVLYLASNESYWMAQRW